MDEENLKEAQLLQSIESNDKLESLNTIAESSLVSQETGNDILKDVSKLMENRIEQADLDTERIIQAIKDKPAVQQIEIKGIEFATIKGEKGDKPSTEELREIIDPLIPTEDDLIKIVKPLIPEPIKGEDGVDGKDYILTENDKIEIAKSIEVPIVEKIIEKTETIIEKPITIDKTKTEIKEVAKYETAEDIANKLNTLSKKIDFKVIKNFPDFSKGGIGLNTVAVDGTTITGNGLGDNPLRVIGGGAGVQSVVAGTNITVDNTDPANPIISSTGGGSGDMTKAVYDPANIEEQVVGLTATQTLTNKTLDSYTNFIHADGIHFRVKAMEDLVRGDVLKFFGFNTGQQAIEVTKRNDTAVPAIGVVDEDMLTGDFGMAVSNGLLKNIDTSAFAEGTILYPDGAGSFTDTPNIATGDYNQQLAYVVRSHAVNGEIMINVGAGHDIASQVAFENAISGMTATNVQDAIDEIVSNLSPAGSDGEIQFNNSGSFGASSDLTWDNDTLGVKGNVGIGTTSPTAKLHTKATTATDIVGIFQGTTSQTANLTEWQNVSGTVLSVVNASGYLGIGTTTPGGLLTVYSTGGVNKGINLTATSGSSYAPIDFNTDAGLAGQFLATGSTFSNQGILSNQTFLANYLTTGGVHLMASGASGYIEFSTGGFATTNERMRIIANGNVGIGTTNPVSKLQINNGTGVSQFGAGSSGADIILSNNSAVYTSAIWSSIFGPRGSGQAFSWSDWDGNPLMTLITATGATKGNVGIGTISPSAKLHTKATSATDIVGIFQGTTSQSGNLTEWRDVSNNILVRVDKDGGGYFLGNLFTEGLLRAGVNQFIYWSGRSLMSSPSDGVIKFTDSTGTDFNRLQFGGTTSSFPAIKRNGAGIDIRLADDSGYAGLNAATLGIGTASPSAKLHVQATSATDTVMIAQGTTSQTGNLTEWRDVGGTAVARISSNGRGAFNDIQVSVSGINISGVGGNGFNVSGGGFMIFKSSGVLTLSDTTDNNWDRLQFGGSTSSFPAIKRSSATLQARLADDSDYATFHAKTYSVNGTAGFTGSGAYTNFVIEGGIITSAS